MNGPSFFVRRGDVWIDSNPGESGKRGRYYIVVSANVYNDDSQVVDVLFARGTLYSSNRPYPYSGDSPILYSDLSDPRLFPNSFRFKFSFFQAPRLRAIAKLDLASERFRCLGQARQTCLPMLDAELATVLNGYDGPRPSKPPRRNSPWPSCLRSGNIVTVLQSGTVQGPPRVIVSHDTIHDLYHHPVTVLVPLTRPSETDVATRYDCMSMGSIDLGFAPNYSFNLQTRLEPEELDDLRAACALALGV